MATSRGQTGARPSHDRRRRVQGRRSCPSATSDRRRHHGRRSGRQDRDHREYRAGLRGQSTACHRDGRRSRQGLGVPSPAGSSVFLPCRGDRIAMTGSRILIACIGNIFLGDDGFGTEVARRLACRALPPEVTLRDFGIRGLDLTYALLDPYELVILADACPRGGEPGTLYLVEPDPVESNTPDGVPA